MVPDPTKIAPGVIVCTHLPPPVDGLAFASLKIIEALKGAQISLGIFDISSDIRNFAHHFKRVSRTVRAVRAILFSSRAFPWVYMPVNAGYGVFYNLAIAISARFRRKRIILHHHSFRYVDVKVGLISLLLRICGKDAVQIVLCDCMRDKLEILYGRIETCLRLPSDYYSAPRAADACARERQDSDPVVMGHLSNLTLEKGLDDCIALHRALIARGDAVVLIIGGPCSSSEARQVLAAAISEFPDSLVYLGPLDEAEKERFYRRIDIFLFPTRYRNEADPIVVSDAQSYGLAAAVVARGCLGERMNDHVGIAVSRDADFVAAILARVPTFGLLRDFARDCGPPARNLHLALRAQADAEFAELLNLIKFS